MPLDYVAQIVQQGRDHGLPKYLNWRRYCGLNQVREFSDLRGMMATDTIDRLRTVYRFECFSIITFTEPSNRGTGPSISMNF